MTLAVIISSFLILGLVAAILLLLIAAWREQVPIATATIVCSTITIIGATIALISSGWSLLTAHNVTVSIPLDPVPVRLPTGVADAVSTATVLSGGADRATLLVAGLTTPTRLLLIAEQLSIATLVICVALAAFHTAKALKAGDVFAVGPRMIMFTGIAVAVCGTSWSILRDIGAWRVGQEALKLKSFSVEGSLAESFDGDAALFLGEHGWLNPGFLSVELPLWPISAGFGLALIATAFKTGRSLRNDVRHLKTEVTGLV